jgi:hypothetical protein
MEQCWMYKKKCLEKSPEGYYGFVYVITDDQGKKYWGKKAFSHKRKRRLSKKARQGRLTRIEVLQVDSKWLNYWGSCKGLLDYIKERGNTDGFTREVIKLCKDKASLTYWETVTLIDNEILFRADTWNGNILGKFFRGKVHK